MTLYADEEGAEAVRALDELVVVALTRVEVVTALWRKHRIGELGADDARVLTAAFAADFHGTPDAPRRFEVVAPTAALLDDAASLAASAGLHASDAVQLAGALAARGADPACDRFACFDARLAAAAAARGFALVPEG